MVGKYEFSGDGDDSLSFKRRERLCIISMEGDWWLVQSMKTGKEGHIPSTYVAKWKSLESEA